MLLASAWVHDGPGRREKPNVTVNTERRKGRCCLRFSKHFSDLCQYDPTFFAIEGFHVAHLHKTILGHEEIPLSLRISMGIWFLCEPCDALTSSSQIAFYKLFFTIWTFHKLALPCWYTSHYSCLYTVFRIEKKPQLKYLQRGKNILTLIAVRLDEKSSLLQEHFNWKCAIPPV